MNKRNLRESTTTDESVSEEILIGLTATPKTISPKFFYDATGSKIFDRICHLPEYYPTRTELDILSQHRLDIIDAIGIGKELVEFGSGSSVKIRLLLQTLKPTNYIPIDISQQHLYESAKKLKADYSWLKISPLCLDYSQPFQLPDSATQRVAFFPGSSIGNFKPDEALEFLTHVSKSLEAGNGLLIGVDTPKEPAILNAAYNDAAGVTADFNLNILKHVNHLTDAGFQPEQFEHVAFFNEDKSRIEMHLQSTCDQQVVIDAQTVPLLKDELIQTESSYKYAAQEFIDLAEQAGFRFEQTWADDKNWFNVHFFTVR